MWLGACVGTDHWFDDFSNLSCPIAQWHELVRPCQPMFQKIEPEAGFQKRISRPPLPPHRFSSKQDGPPPVGEIPMLGLPTCEEVAR